MSVGIGSVASSVVPPELTATITSPWGIWDANAIGDVRHVLVPGTITTSWGTWTATGVGTVTHMIPATVTTSWGTWTATGVGIVNMTRFAVITSSWGTWTATAAGTVIDNWYATITSSWGTWTATSIGQKGKSAVIEDNWNEHTRVTYGMAWVAYATAWFNRFAKITSDWGSWTTHAYGNSRPVQRTLESGVGRTYEDDSKRNLEEREFFDDHGSAPWTPASLPGLVIDLDAANYTNGATWANPGSGEDAPIYSTPLPVRVDAVVNGRPVVRFKTNEGRVRQYTIGVDDDFTLVYVARMTPGATNWIGRIVNGIYSPNNILFGYWNGFQDVAYDNGFAGPNTQTAVTSDWKMYSADGVAGLDRFFGNGVLLGTIGTATGWGDTLAISGYDPTGAAETADCDVARVLLWNRKLSDADRQLAEAYMRTQFALT